MTGSDSYLAPEVIRCKEYDNKFVIVSQSGKKKKNIKKQTISFLFSTSTFLNIINVIGIVLNMYSYQ